MPASFRARLTWLLVALVALMAAVAVLAHRTWSQTMTVRDHFRAVQRESVQLADHVRSAVQELEADALRLRLRHQLALEQEFEKDATALQEWLKEQLDAEHTERERAVLTQISTALTGYLDVARRFDALHPESRVETDDSLFTELGRRSDALLELGFTLAEAHNASLDETILRADQAVTRIEWSIYAALGLLIVTGAGAGGLVYHDYIRPLQRRLQESRRQLEQQEKLAALGVLSAGIAHEIRNPLTAVKARVFTLRKTVRDLPQAHEDVDVINGEVDRLERIVRTFLRFARPPEPELAPVDPAALLRRVHDLVSGPWTEKGVQLEIDPTPAPLMHADAELLEQALLNLVQNAAEAMPQGGVVRLRASAANTSAGRFVRLEVADNGPGIPPEVQRRLFDPFFTTKSTGTGLGLSLTARIIEGHGGHIRFSTSPTHGTVFMIHIPVAPPG